jgi:penicillin amidase
LARRRRFSTISTFSAEPREPRRWPRRVLLGVVGLIPLLGFLAFGVLWLTVPADNLVLRIPGLSAPVDITIDGNGVPRIRAANERDAATALGFIHARDRMFQMELMRRAASGRLSELVGPSALPIDKQMRVFGLARLAEADVAAQSPETRALLEAYAAGVNAWISSRGRLSAIEFLYFGTPEPWRPADSLLWGRTMGLWLSTNYRTELVRQALRDKVSHQELEQLWPRPPAPLSPEARLTGTRFARLDPVTVVPLDPVAVTPLDPVAVTPRDPVAVTPRDPVAVTPRDPVTVILGLDPRITAGTHQVSASPSQVLPVATDARVKPEHDDEGTESDDEGMEHDGGGMAHDGRGMVHDGRGMVHDGRGMEHDDRGMEHDDGGVALASAEYEPNNARPDDRKTASALLAALPAFPAPFTLPSTASDEWAVDGRWSDTGAPLLAGDPHLSFGFPGLWYLVRIEYPGHVLAGATGPGVPFLVMGHNGHIAWTFTTTGADTQDVYLEPPEAKFTSHQERIKVRGEPDVMLTVRETRHGPVISDLSAGKGPVMAVAMANLQPGDTGATGLLALNHARTVEEAGKAAPLIASPVQNLMVADPVKIGLFVTGRVPIRRAGDGWAPVPGIAETPEGTSDDAYGWTGFASGEALPHIVAPASGRLINGNEPVAPPNFPVFMGRDTYRDWRTRRIRTLLDAAPKFSTSDFASMQIDVISTYAAALLPTLRVVPGAPQVLRDWDGAMTENAPQPLIFSAWMDAFHRAVLARKGLSVWASAPVFEFVPFVLSPDGASWCGGDCGPLLKSTLDSTMSSLTARFGPDPGLWRWGAVHQAVFAHPLLRSVPLLGALTTSRIAVPGDGTTLDRGGTDDQLESVHGASYRGVYDLADLDRSLFIVTPGQSGNPLSRHARDFLTRWRDGAMVLLGPRPVDVSGVIRLEPKGER